MDFLRPYKVPSSSISTTITCQGIDSDGDCKRFYPAPLFLPLSPSFINDDGGGRWFAGATLSTGICWYFSVSGAGL